MKYYKNEYNPFWINFFYGFKFTLPIFYFLNLRNIVNFFIFDFNKFFFVYLFCLFFYFACIFLWSLLQCYAFHHKFKIEKVIIGKLFDQNNFSFCKILEIETDLKLQNTFLKVVPEGLVEIFLIAEENIFVFYILDSQITESFLKFYKINYFKIAGTTFTYGVPFTATKERIITYQGTTYKDNKNYEYEINCGNFWIKDFEEQDFLSNFISKKFMIDVFANSENLNLDQFIEKIGLDKSTFAIKNYQKAAKKTKKWINSASNQ